LSLLCCCHAAMGGLCLGRLVVSFKLFGFEKVDYITSDDDSKAFFLFFFGWQN
jgi:hypothetical protein